MDVPIYSSRKNKLIKKIDDDAVATAVALLLLLILFIFLSRMANQQQLPSSTRDIKFTALVEDRSVFEEDEAKVDAPQNHGPLHDYSKSDDLPAPPRIYGALVPERPDIIFDADEVEVMWEQNDG